MTQYLLGSLPEADAEALDELSLSDDEFADELTAAENDLVDAYVHDELTGAELERFKSFYLTSPLRREKVKSAQAFQVFAEQKAAQALEAKAENPDARRKGSGWFSAQRVFTAPHPLLQWGAAAAVLVLLIVGGWLVFENARLHQQISQTQARRDELAQREQELQRQLEAERASGLTNEQELARARQERERLEEELKQEEEQRIAAQERASGQQSSGVSGVSVASFILTPQMRGGGEIKTVSIPAQTDVVLMRLPLEPNDYSTYSVTLLDESGKQTLWNSRSLKAKTIGDSKTLSISLRARLFKPQIYLLRVSGLHSNGASEIISDYPFKVVE